ncbi:protein-L-isoaspartate carboxylmethyltransferase [Microbacterium sp. VKM Ac-2870]|uniref:protein-L-isoaspartate carboxylmethyltransferase n=1 Tax=Microbacterium sp. VKM Ac-2870 TaxID=2783825 RepID=UPI00188BD56D|nr:protein-L-isoaspartate carboxylmethyltransferase [Microbacterium sp. VKM Ac-2870]MBF4562204.1 protein-L-isoaspartate carboxylmethyltransferase [Microbacterium sp. VKM Ac-2870]
MPYRNQETVEAWVRDYLADNPSTAGAVTVLEKNFTPGPDSGLVVVALSDASTVTYIQPVENESGARWSVTFEARADSFELDADGVARLAADLAVVANLCGFLQKRTDLALVEIGTAS